MSDLTTLKVKNGTGKTVTLWITLGAADPTSAIPVVKDVKNLTFTPDVGLVPVRGNPKQGKFKLAAGASAFVAAPLRYALNGNFSYDFPPTQCNPDVGPPPRDGSTLAEFNLNGGQETLDVSCVAGINAQWKCEMDGGEEWTVDAGAQVVASIENKAFGSNSGQPGVFPYGCDDCTASVAPPSCIVPGKDNEKPQAKHICNAQRVGFDEPGGGSVEYSLLGPL